MAVERQVVLGGGKRPSAVVDVLAEGTDLRDYLLAKSASVRRTCARPQSWRV